MRWLGGITDSMDMSLRKCGELVKDREPGVLRPMMCGQVTSTLSDSLQPFGLQPSRLLCPWDSLEKKTRVGFPCLPGDLPNPGIIPLSLMSPALAAGSLPLESPGKFCAAVRGVAKSRTRLTEQQQLCQTG